MDTSAIVAAFMSIAFIGAIVNGFLLWLLAKLFGGESQFIKTIMLSLVLFLVKTGFVLYDFSWWWVIPISWILFVFTFHIVIWRAIGLSLIYWFIDFFFVFGVLFIKTLWA